MVNIRDSYAGKRFDFGKNWKRFLSVLDEERILIAEQSLRDLTGLESLNTKSFLDVGCGSGLFSLAAKRLGARVHSFDYNGDSVECAQFLKEQYFSDDKTWQIEQASALDADYYKTIGNFDVVYSWGVLHHTGELTRALELVHSPLSAGGILVLAIYNAQGWRSKIWQKIKKFYVSSFLGRCLVLAAFIPLFVVANFIVDLLKGRNPLRQYLDYGKNKRGMSVIYDWVDWLGGYPFEVASPEEIVDFFKQYHFKLLKMKTTKGWGCNEYVFVKD